MCGGWKVKRKEKSEWENLYAQYRTLSEYRVSGILCNYVQSHV